MSDIFISYSRKDIAYARILHESLNENGFETWIDWQDIPPSADWLNEVYTAIEQSDTFIFILSDSSTLSEICTLEIEHASKNNKRLIPIVINDVDPTVVHPVLATINWIFSRTKDEFQPAIADLITAIQTDYDWVKAHTRLQMRALEWERANNDKSFLLRGADLSQAEEWFAKAAEKTPEPTLLQTQYLQTSRKEAVKRQRNLLLGVGLALIVSAVLGVVAVINGQRASSNAISLSTQVLVAQNAEATAVQEAFFRATQQTVAEEQRNIAVSRQLAAQGLFVASKQFDLALLLGLEADQRAEGALWASGNLLEIMQTSPHLISFIRNDDDLITGGVLAFSPDGQILAASRGRDSVTLWNVRNPESPVQIGQPITDFTEALNTLVFSPDGKILVSGSNKATIILWDVSNPEAPVQLGLPIDVNHIYEQTLALAFSPDGQILASGSGDDSIILWDLRNPGSPVRIGQPLIGHTNAVERLAFSPDGSILASGSWEQPLILWDVSVPESAKQIDQPLTNRVSGMENLVFDPDGQTLASGHEDQIYALLDLNQIGLSGSLKYVQILPENVDNLVFSPDLQTIASERLILDGYEGKSIILWDISRPSVPKQLGQPLAGHTSNIDTFIFSPDGKILASVDWHGTIILWDLSDADLHKRLGRSLVGKISDVRSVAFSPDGKILAAANADDSIILRNVSDLDSPVQIDQPRDNPFVGGDALAFSPDGQILAGSYRDTIVLWDITNFDSPTQFNQPLTAHTEKILEIVFSPDGQMLASGSKDATIILWDLTNPDLPIQIGQPLAGGRAGNVEGLAFSPDGKILAFGGYGGNIILWDVTNPDFPVRVGQPQDDGGSINCLAFSPDGKILASGSDVIKLWDISNPKASVQIGQWFKGHTGFFVHDLAFSPDGKILASGGDDNTIILWDVSYPNAPVELGQRLTGHTGEVYSLAFSPDGQTLASGSEDDTVILWNINPGTWREKACRLAGRNLTQAEWEKYMPSGEVYEKTCLDLP